MITETEPEGDKHKKTKKSYYNDAFICHDLALAVALKRLFAAVDSSRKKLLLCYRFIMSFCHHASG
jgi:hypothetical protein